MKKEPVKLDRASKASERSPVSSCEGISLGTNNQEYAEHNPIQVR